MHCNASAAVIARGRGGHTSASALHTAALASLNELLSSTARTSPLHWRLGTEQGRAWHTATSAMHTTALASLNELLSSTASASSSRWKLGTELGRAGHITTS